MLSGVSSAISFVDPDKTAPYVHQYSFDLQRELGGNLSGSVAYIGSTGRRLTTAGNVNINQLDPKYLRPELVTRDDAERRQPVFRQPERRQLLDPRDAAAQPVAAAVPAVRHHQHVRVEPRQVAVPRRRISR